MATACSKCGATIDPLALACPYCGLTTPAGVAAHQRAQAEAEARAAWQAQADERGRASAQQAVQKSATTALLWSIAGTVLCCLPLGGVGVFLGARARGAANRARVAIPAAATGAVVLGVLSMLMSTVFITWAFILDSTERKESETRIATLEASSNAGASQPQLDQATACALAEIRVRRDGFDGERGQTLVQFECKGALHALGPDRGRLEDFEFRQRNNDAKRYRVAACFKRGASWYVTSVGDAPCN